MHSYEIEIKSLLGNKEKADQLKAKMQKHPADLQILGKHKELNHYFVNGNLLNLFENVKKYLTEKECGKMENLIEKAKDFSIRTANRDGKILLVIKASVDDTTSANGTARLEFEAEVNLSLEQLDQILLDAGFSYQAKWSRERKEYKFKDLNVSIDKNAGYGYVAEFEKIIDDPSKAEETKSAIRERIALLGLEELAQDRLERMFAYYNQNWQDYYGTEKTFFIE